MYYFVSYSFVINSTTIITIIISSVIIIIITIIIITNYDNYDNNDFVWKIALIIAEYFGDVLSKNAPFLPVTRSAVCISNPDDDDLVPEPTSVT